MKKINEIFYRLQGEGFWAGTPSIFIRFSGCNLSCPFCDTLHESGILMDTEQIMEEVNKYPGKHVVLTGGEPSLFVDEKLITALHNCGKFVAIETNGTRLLPRGIDWITLSPKDTFCNNADILISQCDEIKVVFTTDNPPDYYSHISAKYHCLQPCDLGDKRTNNLIEEAAIEYCLRHPEWRLSVQLHKLLGVR